MSVEIFDIITFAVIIVLIYINNGRPGNGR